jgi:YD repeat-containing protein
MILVIGCSTNGEKNNSPPFVKADMNIINMTCTVYQYNGADSVNQVVAKSIDYCMNGEIATETFNDYMGYDGKYLYYYHDTLLVKRKYVSDNQDSTQTVYMYDSKVRLISEEHYGHERRLRTDIERQGDIVSEEDYEKEKSWAMTSQIKYTYDSLDRKIEYYAPSMHWDNQNRYTWTYNDEGRIKEHRSYDNDKLIWTEEFSYAKNTIRFKRTWFGSGDFSQVTQKLNDNGKLTEENITDEKGEFVSKTRYKYNDDGLIARSVDYDKDDNPITTNIYVYNKTAANTVHKP